MSTDADGYVHEPESGDGDDGAEPPDHPSTADREFGRRGWILVGMLVVALVIAPILIYLLPPPTTVSFRAAYLALPMIPALLLGALAVWATTRP